MMPEIESTDGVIDALLADLAEFTELPPALSVAIHGDRLGYSLALIDPEDGQVLARASAPSFGEALSLVHGRFVEALEEIRRHGGEAAAALQDEEDDDGY
ncbi:hypothetical protein [Amycolatopsis acidicola]|nr:hypothetical protein [Amycolatopsis acidicola]